MTLLLYNCSTRVDRDMSPFRPFRSITDRYCTPLRLNVYHEMVKYLPFEPDVRGERERSPPLPEIMQSRFPHLGNSHGSAQPEVQWLSLALGEPPSWSWYLPCQVSMSCTAQSQGNLSHTVHWDWWCWPSIHGQNHTLLWGCGSAGTQYRRRTFTLKTNKHYLQFPGEVMTRVPMMCLSPYQQPT